MNREIGTKWVSALRSGKYKQGKGVLHDADSSSFCCLGVLCEVMGVEQIDIDSPAVAYGHRSNVTMPGADVLRRAGLSMDQARRLAHFNDNRGRSFHEIADYIEREYLS